MSKTKISNKKRIQILNRDGNKCLWCGRSVVDGVKLEVDFFEISDDKLVFKKFEEK